MLEIYQKSKIKVLHHFYIRPADAYTAISSLHRVASKTFAQNSSTIQEHFKDFS